MRPAMAAAYFARLWVDLTRQLSRLAQPKDISDYGNHLPDLLINLVVYLGMVEGQAADGV